MSKLHGDDFIPVRAFGRRGDKGCDGYLLQSGQLFQCYGKLHDAALSVDTVVNKLGRLRKSDDRTRLDHEGMALRP